MTETACLPCELENASAGEIVYRDHDWACEVAQGYDVPGWFILRTRRHSQGWSGPTPEELTQFGPLSQRLVAAIIAATGARTVYFLSFGENFPHFHFLLTTRPIDLDVAHRGAGILDLRETHRNADAAHAVAGEVRAALG